MVEYGTRRDKRVYPKGQRDMDAAVEHLIDMEIKSGTITPGEANRIRQDVVDDPYYDVKHSRLARLKHEGRKGAVRHKVRFVDGHYEVD